MTAMSFFYRFKKPGIIGIHIIFWVFFFFMPHLLYDLPIDGNIVIARFVELIALIAIFYTNALILVPRFLLPKKYSIYFSFILLIIFGGAQVGSFLKLHFFPKPQHHVYIKHHTSKHISDSTKRTFEYKKSPEYKIYKSHKRYARPRPGFLSVIILIILAISSVYGYALINNSRERKIQDVEKEKLASELSFLKSQINQHFLFNVLNSMYSLSLKKSDVLPGVILKLSDLLRYMTYDTEDKFVDIENEIRYVRNYIDLQKLRLPDMQNITFEVKRHTNKHINIAPLLLVPFIENAFKHGVLSDNKTQIYMYLELSEQTIQLQVRNTYAVHTTKDRSHGVGIQNVKRRLELLYANKHQLFIDTTSEEFNVHVIITHMS
ncbi:MAG: histidine kinase [Bacteroidales bacterium]